MTARNSEGIGPRDTGPFVFESTTEFIPSGSLLERICHFVQKRAGRAYLVGGYVRDRLLGRESHDFDFAVEGNAARLARAVAGWLGGAFVLLDAEHDTARVVTRDEGGQRLFVDFARLRGDDIEADLALRDFTANAMAVDLAEGRLLDPCGGQADLRAGLLRAVSDASFGDDPLRTWRAVRLAAALGLRIEPHTEALIRRDAHLITVVSAERVRDELGAILSLPGTAASLRTLDDLGLLAPVIPEIEPMRGLYQSAPHHQPVLAHSLTTVQAVEDVVAAMTTPPPHDEPLALLSARLAPISPALRAHLAQPTADGRRRLAVLKLLALLHDVGKPATLTIGDDGRTHFYGHEGHGARMVGTVLRRLRFSSDEVALARTVVANHMRLTHLAESGGPTRRAVYRFFRDTGPAGVETLLLSLADHLATYGPHLIPDRWQRRVETAAAMLVDYWQRPAEVIAPPRLISGHDLMAHFGLEPGPRLGELLEAVREAQAEGTVNTAEEALAFVARTLKAERES